MSKGCGEGERVVSTFARSLRVGKEQVELTSVTLTRNGMMDSGLRSALTISSSLALLTTTYTMNPLLSRSKIMERAIGEFGAHAITVYPSMCQSSSFVRKPYIGNMKRDATHQQPQLSSHTVPSAPSSSSHSLSSSYTTTSHQLPQTPQQPPSPQHAVAPSPATMHNSATGHSHYFFH